MRGRSNLHFEKTRRGSQDAETSYASARWKLIFPLQGRPFFHGRSCKGKQLRGGNVIKNHQSFPWKM